MSILNIVTDFQRPKFRQSLIETGLLLISYLIHGVRNLNTFSKHKQNKRMKNFRSSDLYKIRNIYPTDVMCDQFSTLNVNSIRTFSNNLHVKKASKMPKCQNLLK